MVRGPSPLQTDLEELDWAAGNELHVYAKEPGLVLGYGVPTGQPFHAGGRIVQG